jgi:hypothetical protein
VRQVAEQRVDDRHRLLGRADAAVHVHPEDLQLPGEPLVAFDQLQVALLVGDPLRRPVGDRVRAAADHPDVALGGRLLHLGDRAGQVGARLGHRLADAGDDLDARLQQFVLGLRVHAVAVLGDRGEDRVGRARQLARVEIDELEFPLHPETRPLGPREVDTHRLQPIA